MKIGAHGIAVIKGFESCLRAVRGKKGVYTTYYCPANVLTIGWGTTRDDVPDLKPGDEWSQERCDSVFAASLAKYERAVEKAAAGRVKPLLQHQFDALGSLVYNCGPGAVGGSVGRAVREGRDADVPALMARWNKGGGRVLAGLVRRRKAEGLLYAGKIDEALAVAEVTVPGSMPQSREVPKPTVREIIGATKGVAPTATGGVGAAVTGAVSGASPWIIGAAAIVIIAAVAGLVWWQARKLKEEWA